MGLLHAKCVCGLIWLTNMSFKQNLDTIYQAGIRNINLTFIIINVVWPVITVLSLLVIFPYLFFVGLLHGLGKISDSNSNGHHTYFIFFRFCILFIFHHRIQVFFSLFIAVIPSYRIGISYLLPM